MMGNGIDTICFKRREMQTGGSGRKLKGEQRMEKGRLWQRDEQQEHQCG